MHPRVVAVALSFAVTLSGCAVGDSSASDPSASTASLVSIGAGLQGPAGSTATVYATGLVHASAFALDARGWLWVATSDATDHGDDGIYLVASGGATPVEVIDELKGPLGLLWRGGTLYVASIGRVDAFSGLRGARFVHRRLILKDPVAGAWNNNLVVAPNGRLVMSISTACDHCTPASKWLAAIVTFRADGSDLRVYARGVRDGFGLTYAPGTEDLFVSINQRDDLGDATPGDWLAVIRKGQDWGFPACYGQGGVACAGVPAPLAVLDPHAAAGGVAIVTASSSGLSGSSALVAEWSMGTVQRVRLTAARSGYTGTVEPFLTGLKNPLPVLAAGARNVFVGDWGTGTVYTITGV